MSAPALRAEDFPAFFQAVHGYLPFPWQGRLLGELVARRRWPDLLDLPTGSGKTAAIDAAVFHLALEADRGEDRRARMRIAFVVDRRLVVDEAFDRARKLEAALLSPMADIVHAVAARLRLLAGPRRPHLVAARMRGGAPREDDWAKTPCQPTVLCSTVDQVGSRLLFRGYGVSDRMKPVHAGLLGSDTLVLLDEAHLAEPFRQTARDISIEPALHGPDPRPLSVALLTATPGIQEREEWRFALDEKDISNRVLARRMSARKPAKLVVVDENKRAGELARQALALIGDLKREGVNAPVIGIVANRIARARDVHTEVAAAIRKQSAFLIIGRSRGVDRDRIASNLEPIKTGRNPRPTEPLVVVATQTIEAGVDIDFDALVCDAASIDALRQRFGRLNRDGRPVPSRAVVIAGKTDRKPNGDGDPVYGHAITHTLEALWPEGNEEVDFGTTALNQLLADKNLVGAGLSPLLSEKPNAPVLMPAYVDLWSQTSPIPSCEPEPSLFLHGPKREPASIQVVWRADVKELIERGANDQLRELLRVVPPRTAEAIELPLHAARSWLRGAAPDLGDIAEAPGEEDPGRKSDLMTFRWRGPDDGRSQVIDPAELRPGDLIIVPSDYGGCDEYGWRPDDNNAGIVGDVGDKAAEPFLGRRIAVRIAPGLIRQALAEVAGADLAALEDQADRISQRVAAALGNLGSDASADDVCNELESLVPEPLKKALRRFRDKRNGRAERLLFPYGDDTARPGVVLFAPHGLTLDEPEQDDAATGSTEDDSAGSFVGEALPLLDHARHVSGFASAFAMRSGLPPALVSDLALAGWLHDAGKADPRFQRLLAGGDFFALESAAESGGQSVLAKSAAGRCAAGAWSRAGLPDGWRHEAFSVRLALLNPRLNEAHDRGLVLWLVGVHHGLGRPFFDFRDDRDRPMSLTPIEGLTPDGSGNGIGPERLGFAIPEEDRHGPTSRDKFDLRGLDWSTLFRDLRRRYGPWGLARLEAVLRLADHRASEAARQGFADKDDAA